METTTMTRELDKEDLCLQLQCPKTHTRLIPCKILRKRRKDNATISIFSNLKILKKDFCMLPNETYNAPKHFYLIKHDAHGSKDEFQRVRTQGQQAVIFMK